MSRKPEVAPRVNQPNHKKFVKYVDFKNHYSKEYQQPDELVIEHRRPKVPGDNLNAMEEARIFNQEEIHRGVNQGLMRYVYF